MSQETSFTSVAPRAESEPQLQAPYQFTRRGAGGTLRRTGRLAELMQTDALSRECWMFVGPHDDDLCIGGGLLMQAAVEAGVDVQAVIVTDGRQGYCTEEHEDDIVSLRREETLRSFEVLGIDSGRVRNLGFPDGGLSEFLGRRKPRQADKDSRPADDTPVGGYVGLQNSFTQVLRDLRPARVFVPTPTDLHPDHRMTHSELMISLFHACGPIWPELGPPLLETPRLYELAVYCDFAEPPNLEIIADEQRFANKLQSVSAFASQTQIGALVDSLKKAGPFEYVREVEFRLYCPDTYKPLFREERRAEG